MIPQAFRNISFANFHARRRYVLIFFGGDPESKVIFKFHVTSGVRKQTGPLLYADMQVFEFTASSMCIGYRNSVLY
jgi:hypothetical protein